MKTIDVHAHYFPPALLERLLRGEQAPAGVSLEQRPGGTLALKLGTGPASPVPPGMTDVTDRLAEMKRQGVDQQWLTLWVAATGYGLEPEAGAAWSRMVNEAMAEAVKGHSAFIGAATVPLQDGRRAAAELEHALNLGLTGLILGTYAGSKSLDDPDLEPLWQTAEAAGAPIMIHPFQNGFGARTERYYLANLIAGPADTTITAAQLIFGGVPDRHPDLKVLLVHGGGFLPYQIGRWERGQKVRPETRVNNPQKRPSEYLRWFYYDTVTHSAPALRYLTDLVGEGRVALGTDFPFDMADPNPRLTVAQAELGLQRAHQVEIETPAAFLGEVR